jgi:hypothetical protein
MGTPNSSMHKANLRMGLNRTTQSPSPSQFPTNSNIGAGTDTLGAETDTLVPKRALHYLSLPFFDWQNCKAIDQPIYLKVFS